MLAGNPMLAGLYDDTCPEAVAVGKFRRSFCRIVAADKPQRDKVATFRVGDSGLVSVKLEQRTVAVDDGQVLSPVAVHVQPDRDSTVRR